MVEAVVEELSVKKALFAALDEICKPGVVLATTTSSLPVIECAMATQPPGRRGRAALLQPGAGDGAGRGGAHDPDLAARRWPPPARCARALGKHAVVCADRAGFVVNALLFPYLNDAVRMLEAQLLDRRRHRPAMKLGCGYPMGPFELLDVVGLDVSLAIQRELYLELREPGFAPAPLLEHLVTAGYLGRKAGRGFRDYPLTRRVTRDPARIRALVDPPVPRRHCQDRGRRRLAGEPAPELPRRDDAPELD